MYWPLRSVRVLRVTDPESDVTMTVASPTGADPGAVDVTRPRMTSDCCAAAGCVVTLVTSAATNAGIRTEVPRDKNGRYRDRGIANVTMSGIRGGGTSRA